MSRALRTRVDLLERRVPPPPEVDFQAIFEAMPPEQFQALYPLLRALAEGRMTEAEFAKRAEEIFGADPE